MTSTFSFLTLFSSPCAYGCLTLPLSLCLCQRPINAPPFLLVFFFFSIEFVCLFFFSSSSHDSMFVYLKVQTFGLWPKKRNTISICQKRKHKRGCYFFLTIIKKRELIQYLSSDKILFKFDFILFYIIFIIVFIILSIFFILILF